MKTVLAEIRALERRISTYRAGALACDMEKDCSEPVSHIDEKGFVYCKRHGLQRKHSMRCRELSKAELKQLQDRKPLNSYRPSRNKALERKIAGETRLEHIWTLKNDKRFYITHADGTDGWHLYDGKKWIIPYRSLVGAKRYLAKLVGKPYEEIEFNYTTKKL